MDYISDDYFYVECNFYWYDKNGEGNGINSLHFDYGVGFGKLKESSNIYDDNFVETTTNRTMNYFGWGFQPVIYNSESEKWSVNAMFDFGKFKWTNGNGNTSSFKMSTVGFGVQYNF